MAGQRANVSMNVADRKKRLLLVVDSDADALVYTSTLLKRFGYQTSTAKTGREALDMVRGAAPSLIITSLGLMDMHGLDLMRNLNKNAVTAAVPFITLRRHGDLLGEKRSLESGAVDCLYQPVAAEKLYLAIQTATETKPRSCIRLQTTQPVKMDDVPFDVHKSASSSDLSERGMFLQCAEPAAVNTRLPLHIFLSGKMIVVEALVIYSYRTAGGPYLQPGMGLEFVQITPKDRDLIRQFIRNEVMRGIAPGHV